MITLVKYVVYDILRNRILIGYTLLLLALGFGLFYFSDDSNKALLSILNLVLIVAPLVSMVFAAIHWYNASEFIELLLAQPISRQRIFLGEYAGVSLSLSYAFLMGIGLPVLLFSPTRSGLVLVLAGWLATLASVSLAFLAASLTRDKARGIGVALLLWLYFSLIYDGIALAIMVAFQDYPMEKAMLALTALNPIDLARVMILLEMDISALMGYTGAIFKRFFDGSAGIMLAMGTLLLWIVWPVLLANRVFRKKDL